MTLQVQKRHLKQSRRQLRKAGNLLRNTRTTIGIRILGTFALRPPETDWRSGFKDISPKREGQVNSSGECVIFSSRRRSCYQGRASKIRLKGVCVARRKWEKPPDVTTSRSRFSPACAPRASPTSCANDAGVQISADA